MKPLKICAQIFLVIFVLSLTSNAYAEEKNGIWYEDGESFNLNELDNALALNNLAKAETVYDDFFKRRQKMLTNGSKFGFLDMRLKYIYAVIQFQKNNYQNCIAATDEVLKYLFAHLNEGHDKDFNWLSLMQSSMFQKKIGYDALKDYENSLNAQKDLVNFLEERFPSDDPDLLKEKIILSVCYANAKDYESASALNEKILPQVEKVFGSKAIETRTAKKNLARIYSYALKYSDAVKVYEEILQSDIEVYGENDLKTLESYDELINAYIYLNKFQEAELLLNRVIPIVEKNLNDNSQLKQNILMNQALNYFGSGQIQNSTEAFERLLKMPISNRDKVTCFWFMAMNYQNLADYTNAMQCALKAWDFHEKYLPENKRLRIHLLNFLGTLYSEMGNNAEGIKYLQNALDLSVKLFGYDSEETLNSRKNLVGFYQLNKQYDKALELSKENYALNIKLFGDDEKSNLYIMGDIALAYYGLKDYKSGIIWAKKASDTSTKLFGEKNIVTQSHAIMLSNFYMKDKTTVDAAIKLLEPIVKSEISAENAQFADIALLNLADAYSRSSRWKEAIPLLEKLIEIRENRIDNYGSLTANEKRFLFSEQSLVYFFAATLYLKDDNFKDAFRILERGKSRILIDSYSEQLIKSSGILNKQEVVKLNEYKAKLINLSKKIDDAFKAGDEKARVNLEAEQRNLSNEYAKYKKSLQNKYPKYKTVSQANKLDFDRDKNILPENTGFVEYAFDNGSIIAFTFDKNSDVHAVKMDVPKNFVSTCNLYHELLAYPNLQTVDNDNKYLLKFPDGSYKITIGANIEKGSGAELVDSEEEFNELKQNLSKSVGEVLLSPLKDYISGYTNLIISPAGILNNIPFETLEFNGKLAIESFNISYVPSFSVFKLMHEAGEKNSKLTNRQELFAMGNAFYGENEESSSRRSIADFSEEQRGKFDITELKKLKWVNLDGTKEEIDKVSEMFRTKKIFSEKSASESNLKLSNHRDEISKYKYLLFATHGIFIPYAPQYSSIVLSQGVDLNEDGYVTVGEWMGFNLNSDLIFLSACESGLGEYQIGEGIVGIPYALTIAGNKNTVMSLWKVYDEATAEFVSAFFKKISDGKSAVIALNETKREFLKSPVPIYNNPAIWAAFLLYGF